MFRIVVGAVLVIGAAVGWFVAAGPSIMLGSMKDDYVAAAEAGGIDMSKCKARQTSLLDPSGGMAMCAQDVFRDVERQLREIEESEANAPSWDDAPSYDESAEAPPND